MKVTLTENYLQECLKQAKYYEYCKDSDRAMAVMKPIWKNFEVEPDVSGLDARLACEIMLICGSLTSSYGTNRQLKNYLDLANNIMWKAREMAIALNDRDLIAESEKHIAVSYWRHGQFDNAVAYSNTVLGHYTELEQLTHRTCLFTQANLLVLYVNLNRSDKAFEILNKLKPFVDDCDDLWIKTVFYNQASGVYVYSDQFELAIPILEKTIEYATLSKNDTYIANALNNLANAYINIGKAKEAMEYIDRALKILLKNNQNFYYAVYLETKAQIYIKLEDFNQALLLIDESISILSKGENYEQYCESLWTRIVILLKSGERYQAMRQYNNLISVVKEHLSLASEDYFIAKFDKLIYLIEGNHFDVNEKNFRKYILDHALGEGGGIITATAKILNVDHQRLSNMVSKFPELKEKHKVKLITRRSHLPVKGKSKQTSQTSIAIRLQNDHLKSINLKKGQVVNVHIMNLHELDFSRPIVIKDSKKVYHCGFLIDMFGLFAFQKENGDIDKTFHESEIIQSGQIVGVHDPNVDRFVPLEL